MLLKNVSGRCFHSYMDYEPQFIPPRHWTAKVEFDEVQREVLTRVAAGESLRGTGVAGSGKTSVAICCVSQWYERANASVSGVDYENLCSAMPSALLVTASRRSADMCNRSCEFGALEISRPARSAISLAFAILQLHQQLRGDPEVTLLTGADEDALLRRLLTREKFPGLPDNAAEGDKYRQELRDLFARCYELCVAPADLGRTGEAYHEDNWVKVSPLFIRFDEEQQRTRQYSSARMLRAASEILRQARENDDQVFLKELPRLIVVDDMQDQTRAAVDLYRELWHCGGQLVLLSNPSVATQVYRGGQPEIPKCFQVLPELVLGRDYREMGLQRSQLISGNEAGEYRAVASWLRDRHFLNGVEYADMAVIARSNTVVSGISDALEGFGLPCVGVRQRAPLGRHPLIMELTRLASGGAYTLADFYRLISSPLVGADSLIVERIRRFFNGSDPAVLAAICASLGVEPSETEIVVRKRTALEDDISDREVTVAEFTGQVGFLDDLEEALGQQVVDAVRRAAALLSAREHLVLADPAISFWRLWQAADRADYWREQALHGYVLADEYLDVMLKLFRDLDFYMQRADKPNLSEYLKQLSARTVVTDTIAQHGQEGEGITVGTPTQLVGLEFDSVAVIGVNTGQWPTRAGEDQYFRPNRLAAIVESKSNDSATKQLSHTDVEERLFNAATTRARSALLVSAVDEKDGASPSLLFTNKTRHYLQYQVGEHLPLAPVSLTEFVGALRARAIHESASEQERREAVAALRVLADSGIAAADPDNWSGVWARAGESFATSDDPVVGDNRRVRISPSMFESALNCPLRWFLNNNGASRDSVNMQMGSYMHQLLETHPDGTGMYSAFLETCPLPRETWVEEQEYQRFRKAVEKLEPFLRGQLSGRAAKDEIAPVVPVVDDRDLECSFQMDIPGGNNAVVSGKIDRIVRTDEGMFIIDYKTGKSAISVADARQNPQLRLYQLAAKNDEEINRGDTILGAELAYPADPAKVNIVIRSQLPLTEEDVETVTEQLQQVVEMNRGALFPARVGDQCRNCDMKAICPQEARYGKGDSDE